MGDKRLPIGVPRPKNKVPAETKAPTAKLTMGRRARPKGEGGSRKARIVGGKYA